MQTQMRHRQKHTYTLKKKHIHVQHTKKKHRQIET